MAGSDFSVNDADALLELIYSSPSGRIIIVGGQAVNFWADRYAPDKPELLAYRPFTSRDLDLLGSIADAYQLASKTHSVVEKPRRGAASPVLAGLGGAPGCAPNRAPDVRLSWRGCGIARARPSFGANAGF